MFRIRIRQLLAVMVIGLASSTDAFAVDITVCYSGGDSATNLNSGFYDDLRAKLTNPANFGDSGTFGTINWTFLQFGSPDVANLGDDCDIWHSGQENNTYSPAEEQALLDFVTTGGTVLATCDFGNIDEVCELFGASVTNGGEDASDPVPGAEPLICGDFGAGTQLIQDGQQASFSSIPATAQVVTEHPTNGNPTTIYLDGQQVILMTDTMFHDDTLSDGANVTTANDFFAMRIFGALASASQDVTPDCVNTLPVTLSHFESRLGVNRLRVAWQTASETFTTGFNVWGLVNENWIQLNRKLIRTKKLDSIRPQSYRARISIRHLDGPLEELAITSVDFNGLEQGFGPFDIGVDYGTESTYEPVPWEAIAAENAARMEALGYVYIGNRWRKPGRALANRLAVLTETAEAMAHIGVSESGMVRVTHEDLLAAGVDLSAIVKKDLAVTWKGNAVPRSVGGPGRRFGPGSHIDFYGEPPKGDDALYLTENVYQVGYDPLLAMPVKRLTRKPGMPENRHHETVRVEEQVSYANVLPSGDPFHMGILIATGGNGATWPAGGGYAITVGDDIDIDAPAYVEVHLAAISDPAGQDIDGIAGIDPDHAVEILVNGQPAVLDNPTAEGYGDWLVTGALNPGALQPGENLIQVRMLPTGYTAPDLLALDGYGVRYPRTAASVDNRLHWDGVADLGADGFEVSGFSQRDVLAYAFAASTESLPGNLVELKVRRSRAANGTYTATFAATPDPAVHYWVSTAEQLNAPASITAVTASGDLLSQQGDYLLIGHRAFLPGVEESAVDDHPLNRYVAAKELEGYQPVLVDYDELVEEFGFGMRTPDAITRYLRAASEAFDYDHVLLIGGDVYDYLDRLESGAISYIPTRYDVTAARLQYTPSDALIMDLDGDGVSDRAHGRWPVRTQEELEIIVDKTLDYGDMATGGFDDRTALLIAEEFTPQEGYDFDAQMDRLTNRLQSPSLTDPSVLERWDATADAVDRVSLQQLYNDPGIAPGEVLAIARQQIIDAINQPGGQALTIFGGHGSPQSWSFSSLMTPAIAANELTNDGTPTLMMPMACYTTYHNDVHTNTLAHQLLLAGGGGAVAIHAAATLSGYHANEALAHRVLRNQLVDRDTLGVAINRARRSVANRDLRITWTLLGDPTLRVQ